MPSLQEACRKRALFLPFLDNWKVFLSDSSIFYTVTGCQNHTWVIGLWVGFNTKGMGNREPRFKMCLPWVYDNETNQLYCSIMDYSVVSMVQKKSQNNDVYHGSSGRYPNLIKILYWNHKFSRYFWNNLFLVNVVSCKVRIKCTIGFYISIIASTVYLHLLEGYKPSFCWKYIYC